jgi:ornithine carbamoyltransferase
MSHPKNFIDLHDFPADTIEGLIQRGIELKKGPRFAVNQPLLGRTLALIFEQPSTRTRISFDVGMQQLGGFTLMLTGAEMQLGRGETVADTARVLSRYVDAIMIRTLDQHMLHELATTATVPVINGMTKLSHPCQVLADLMTFEERKGSIRGRTVAWTGDANNVLASWMHAASVFGFTLKIATPPQYAPRPSLRAWADSSGADIRYSHDSKECVRGADCVITDTFVSMGDEHSAGDRLEILSPYQVTEELMALAADDAIFMHCLPAHRGQEVTDAVIDGPHSAVWDEAENRLHTQKALLEWCLT